ncbi:MAG: transmembrane 220 family protein [Gemmatimonadota bacterium]
MAAPDRHSLANDTVPALWPAHHQMEQAMSNRIWKVVNTVVLIMFVFSAIVQLNDPDPLIWVALYVAAAGACLLELVGRDRWWFPTLLFVLCVAWAATLAPRVVGQVPFMSMFGAFEMKSQGIEESREMYGLLIVGAWMAVLALRARRGAGERGIGRAGA